MNTVSQPVGAIDVALAHATRLLEKRGHFVKVTGNGREALEALAKDQYDLILMDVQMPEMDGIAATIALREMEKENGKHQLVVALTAMVIKPAMRGGSTTSCQYMLSSLRELSRLGVL